MLELPFVHPVPCEQAPRGYQSVRACRDNREKSQRSRCRHERYHSARRKRPSDADADELGRIRGVSGVGRPTFLATSKIFISLPKNMLSSRRNPYDHLLPTDVQYNWRHRDRRRTQSPCETKLNLERLEIPFSTPSL